MENVLLFEFGFENDDTIIKREKEWKERCVLFVGWYGVMLVAQ